MHVDSSLNIMQTCLEFVCFIDLQQSLRLDIMQQLGQHLHRHTTRYITQHQTGAVMRVQFLHVSSLAEI